MGVNKLFSENEMDRLFKIFSFMKGLLGAPAEAFTEIADVLRKHGIEADTAALDVVIADAARRKAIADREATVDLTGSISTGSTGE